MAAERYRAASFGASSVGASASFTCTVFSTPCRTSVSETTSPGRCAADHALQRRDVIDVVTVSVDDDVALLDSSRLRWARTVLREVRDERPANLRNAALRELVCLRVLLRHFGELKAEDAATNVPVLDDLVHDVAHERHGNREAIAGVAASGAGDRRVHADHFAAHVHQRTTGVPRIDRRVGLDVVDDGIRAVVETSEPPRPLALTMPCVTVKSRPSGLPIARTQSPTRAVSSLPSGNGRKVVAVDLDDGNVGRRIATYDLRVELAPVGEDHGHLVRVGDDVVVRENQSIGRDDEARARGVNDLIFLALTAMTAATERRACPCPGSRTDGDQASQAFVACAAMPERWPSM